MAFIYHHNEVCTSSEKKIKKTVVLMPVFLMFFITCELFGQNHFQQFEDDKILQELFMRLDSLASKKTDETSYQVGHTLDAVELLFKTLRDTTSLIGERSTEIALERDAIGNDIGLSLRGSYAENIEQGFFSSGDIFYDRRFTTGLHWDILENGFISNRKRSDELVATQKIVEREELFQHSNEVYERLYNRIIQIFNMEKIHISRNYLKLLSLNLEINHRLYYHNFIPWEEVLEISSKKARTEIKLNSYKKYSLQFENKSNTFTADQFNVVKKLPILNINFDTLFEAIENDNQELHLSEEDLKGMLHNGWTDISLSAFANYNIFDGIGNRLDPESLGGREYFSIGVNLSIPLPVNSRKQREASKARINKHLNNQEAETFSRQKELFNLYYEYQYRLQHLAELYKNYKVRQQAIFKHQRLNELNDPEFSLQRLSNNIMQSYALEIEMIEKTQQLYLNLVNIDRHLPLQSILHHVEITDIKSFIPELSD
jgi:hypothetical protein